MREVRERLTIVGCVILLRLAATHPRLARWLRLDDTRRFEPEVL